MSGIHAGVIAAEMIDRQMWQAKTHQSDIGDPMGASLIKAVFAIFDSECPIATGIVSGHPFPTRAEIGPMDRDRSVRVNLRPKAVWQTGIPEGMGGKLKLHRKVIPFVAVQPEVICLAAALILSHGA